jgi:hypothetical protein
LRKIISLVRLPTGHLNYNGINLKFWHGCLSVLCMQQLRVARWNICIPKIPCFVRPWNGICCIVHFTAIWNILLPFGRFYGDLVYFVVNWYISPVRAPLCIFISIYLYIFDICASGSCDNGLVAISRLVAPRR